MMLGPRELKIILRDAAACELVRLAWTGAASGRLSGPAEGAATPPR
jgi:hypothetical protein